jgi:signal transduction histidine kinase
MPGPRLAPRPDSNAPHSLGPDARNSFLRLVSHELRTPLNSIIGFSELLSSQAFGPLGAPQYEQYAQIIRDSGHKMLKLVGQILELVRLREGVARLNLETSPAGFAVQDALDMMRTEAEARGVALMYEETRPAPWAWVDQRGLRTVATNLLQNAVQVSPEGGRVDVRVSPKAEQVLIEILDRGPGLAEEDIERVLRPFDEGDYALTRRTQGAGLGLPIARLLCELMGGELWLHNREDGGMAACILLPRAEPEEVAPGGARP